MSKKVEFTTFIEINASAEKVWSIFADTSKYSQWNPFIKAIWWGSYSLHKKFYEIGYVVKHIYLPFPMTVTAYIPNQKIIYQGSLFAFHGHHEYMFQEVEKDKIIFSHAASFSGIFFLRSKNHINTNVRRVHEEMNLALKKRAEES